LDTKDLIFPNDFRPTKRLCAFHASIAICFAVENGWMSKDAAPSVPEDAFGSPNFDEELMKAFLKDQRELLTLEPRHLNLGSSSSLPSS
jgi:hypothetical protein